MKKLSILLLLVCISFTANAQTAEELKKEQAPKKAQIAKLQGEVKALQAKIDALPGWRKGAFGTIGASLSGFNNWYARTAPNTSAGNIGITVNGFANLIEEDFFWRNSGTINLGWVKIDDKDDPTDSDKFETATDVFTISSLYGKRLNKKWAISALGEYRTTLLDNFNDPGYLDLGAGATWTPTSHLVVVIHPGNYNFVFSSGDTVFESSLGAKIVADYTNKYKGLSVKSNLSMFQSYKDGDLSNWTWTNSFGYTIWKGIGLGFELGLRNNKQEAANFQGVDLGAEDNKLQSYWLFGLSYAF
ncbi:DUF3078 domain-containing protein [Polaribacter vadi]|uniref:DUF3078 domain-containing protein n=1 Tax=Polaribacter TaxID=52959 RepID=UPI001C08148B|nr:MULTISPECIES: DUF3078 domain-containing protein [Polaribacter]MBU3011034.1 DUF3078 domain-containing protein [Polaribacter vadi]MDO6740848.1 DUF3078 domain-containing protein [Polaribacter sp. 1_MG-2023]